MSVFSAHSNKERCAVIVDVGSGSVGIAVVISDEEENLLQVVWSYREHMLIKDVEDEFALLKDINTTLINAFLELGSVGLQTLHTYNPKLTVKYLQVAISAPWSYTVTKNILFEDQTPFVVTEKLIRNLIQTAVKESAETEIQGEMLNTLGLRVITDATIQVQLNGYYLENPIGNSCNSISLSHICALAQEKILSTITELQSKVLPKTEISLYSFMYVYFQVLKNLHPDTSEVCLIDITNEATEIGIVRDNVLTYTTHAPFGLYSIAREISKTCAIPKEEAYALLKGGINVQDAYGAKNSKQLETIFLTYQNEITDLFKRTGDSLSIPKTLFLHTSQNTESFFSNQIKSAARNATSNEHSIHLFTSELLGDKSMTDTALALSVYHFHAKNTYTEIQLLK